LSFNSSQNMRLVWRNEVLLSTFIGASRDTILLVYSRSSFT